MRAFIGIPIADALKLRILEIRSGLERAAADVKWEKPDHYHLTLKFLGEIEEVDRLRELLRAIALPPFDVEFAGLGTFPRVVWIDVKGDVAKLRDLAAACEKAALEIGVEKEARPWTAHLTIGRVRSSKNLDRLWKAVKSKAAEPVGPQRVEDFALYRSTLTPQGAVYEIVERFPLRPV